MDTIKERSRTVTPHSKTETKLDRSINISPQPPQHQDHQPGIESQMSPRPLAEDSGYHGSGKLMNKVALITGGDSGIGRAVAIAFAKEGADVGILYLEETEDAEETSRAVENLGRNCRTLAGDIGDPKFCYRAVKQMVGASKNSKS